MPVTIEEELIRVAREWDHAMVGNDPDTIGGFMADDWTIVGSDGTMTDKPAFLGFLRSGALSHDVMDSEDFIVRVYGETAVMTCRGVSGGTYLGQRFREVERASNVFVRHGGEWKCVWTHLSRLT